MTTNFSIDYYQLFNLPATASTVELRSAYHRLALLSHPDRNPNDPYAEERFKRINTAYRVLADPASRAQYDVWLASSAAQHVSPAQAWAQAQSGGTHAGRVDADAVPSWLLAGLATVAVFLAMIVVGLAMWRGIPTALPAPAESLSSLKLLSRLSA